MIEVRSLVKDAYGNNVLDIYGALTWETQMRTSRETKNEAGETIHEILDPPEPVTEPMYKTRYILADGTVTNMTDVEYETRKASDPTGVFRAAFVGCTYHCG
jgi:hypothetical protein